MTFSLKTVIIEPEKPNEIKNIIILLHGYGGDGKDISILALNWKRFLPNTIFLCPNGHEKCSINPAGYQWFDLSKEDPSYILKESIDSEKKIVQFIREVKNKYKIDNNKICLSGFSQGCMLAINIGLTTHEDYNCIVGFSGKILDKNNISKRIVSKTKFLLLHGDKDDIVPSKNLLDAKDFLIRNKIQIETNMIENCGHHISTKASSLALNYIKNNLSS